MRPVQHTVRLSLSLDKALRLHAEQQGISVYAALQRSVKTGLVTLVSAPEQETVNREIISELASVSTGLVDIERVLDRALFTACAAYCYARNAALGLRRNDEAISIEINAAYDRQRQLSQEGQP